jgi:cystathionine beta-lyase
MTHPYDALTMNTLRTKANMKWQQYPAHVLPLWVADMDFPVAEPIKQALRAYVDTDNFGYPPRDGLPGLRESLQARLSERYGWQVDLDALEPMSGIIVGLHLACLICASAGEEVIIQPPVYPPFISTILETGRVPLYNGLLRTSSGWDIDFEALERSITPATRLLMFCNPHNPTGRVFRRDELERLAALVLRHRLWVVSDELHSDLVFDGQAHIPFASLGEEVSERTVTLMGPTKTFNIAGLRIGFVISQNPSLLARFKLLAGHLHAPNVLAQAAAVAAYREGGAWLQDTLRYLDANRQFLAAFLAQELPQVRFSAPEGTYLSWLDLRGLELGDDLYRFLLEEAKVGLNEGPHYGPGGEGFARINFATSRALVQEAVERIRDAYRGRQD